MSNLFSKDARKGDIEVKKFDEFLQEKPSDGKLHIETNRSRLAGKEQTEFVNSKFSVQAFSNLKKVKKLKTGSSMT
jgi:hypothetical protein